MGGEAISTEVSLVSRKSYYHILKQLDEKGYEIRTPRYSNNILKMNLKKDYKEVRNFKSASAKQASFLF